MVQDATEDVLIPKGMRPAWLVIGQQNSRAFAVSFPGVVVKANKVVKLTDQHSQLTTVGVPPAV
jgi:hypothetical protein